MVDKLADLIMQSKQCSCSCNTHVRHFWANERWILDGQFLACGLGSPCDISLDLLIKESLLFTKLSSQRCTVCTMALVIQDCLNTSSTRSVHLTDSIMLVYPAEVSQMSSRLSTESKFYADKAKDLNRQVCNLLQLDEVAPTLCAPFFLFLRGLRPHTALSVYNKCGITLRYFLLLVIADMNSGFWFILWQTFSILIVVCECPSDCSS